MSVVTGTTTPLVIFGNLDAELWGIVVGGSSPSAAVATIDRPDVTLAAAELNAGGDTLWTLTAPGLELRIEGEETTTASADGAASLTPCRINGAVTVDGSEREVELGGTRIGELPTHGVDSMRLLGAWFPDGYEMSLLATRPKGVKGHDRDAVSVAARGLAHPVVIEPRLSSTYHDNGSLMRIGVEQWMGDTPDSDEQWSRRVAGAATGSHVAAAEVTANALRCISRGELGAGVYVLLRP